MYLSLEEWVLVSQIAFFAAAALFLLGVGYYLIKLLITSRQTLDDLIPTIENVEKITGDAAAMTEDVKVVVRDAKDTVRTVRLSLSNITNTILNKVFGFAIERLTNLGHNEEEDEEETEEKPKKRGRKSSKK